jgi:hypothetical protein
MHLVCLCLTLNLPSGRNILTLLQYNEMFRAGQRDQRQLIVSIYKMLKDPLPPWDMPSDPVKAALWFMHWLLKILVRFFWLPILFLIAYEVYQNWSLGGVFNGLISGIITLFVGLGIWALLSLVLFVVNLSVGISQTISEAIEHQQQMTQRLYPHPEEEAQGPVVEGTITELEEERKKRRPS